MRVCVRVCVRAQAFARACCVLNLCRSVVRPFAMCYDGVLVLVVVVLVVVVFVVVVVAVVVEFVARQLCCLCVRSMS